MKQPYDLDPDDRADESVRKILLRLFGRLRENVARVIEDVDTEFLHDLRVANRRTRTVLSQIKDVLPASVVDTFRSEFKWLGDVTGPCRDLDVFLLEMDSYQQRSKIDDGALRPLQDFLTDKRQVEHHRVRAALQSARLQDLAEGWGRFLETTTTKDDEPPLASTPIVEVASPRIHRAYRRMWKRSTGRYDPPPAAVLHRLRIDGKKLRYLLEFFSDLYTSTTVSRFINELKQLQDILGGLNDTVVQLALIDEFADQRDTSATTLAAMSRLTDAIANRQRELRTDFADHFALFAGDESRKRYRKKFKAG